MKRLMIIAALATVAVSTTAYTPAQARDGAIAASIIGSAASQPRSYYTGPAYVEPSYAPVYSACRVEREQVVDQWGRVGYRRIRVCD